MTGGLQEQVVGPSGMNGIGLYPSSKAIIGSQQVPYIYEDRISKKAFLAALNQMYDGGEEFRRELGDNGRKHILENYNFETFNKKWVELMLDVYERNGSWETRKNYSSITFKEVA